MTKRYSILRKKLQELESTLTHVFSLPVTTPCSQLVLEEIHQRFVFAKNLLSAEVASHPSKPHHLQHLAQRLKELNHDFREWESLKASDFTHVDHDNASGCSCTESCLNDDGEASVYEEDPDGFSQEEGWNWGLWGAMAIGVLLGIAFMGFVMARISGCFYYVEPLSFRTPT
ncbi:hypothetical protein SLA2020_303690 [Shorea laevis]